MIVAEAKYLDVDFVDSAWMWTADKLYARADRLDTDAADRKLAEKYAANYSCDEPLYVPDKVVSGDHIREALAQGYLAGIRAGRDMKAINEQPEVAL